MYGKTNFRIQHSLWKLETNQRLILELESPKGKLNPRRKILLIFKTAFDVYNAHIYGENKR